MFWTQQKNSSVPSEKIDFQKKHRTNIAPEKWWLEDYFPIGRQLFRGELLNFRRVIVNITAPSTHHQTLPAPKATFGDTGGTASSKSNPAGGPRNPNCGRSWSFMAHFFQTWKSILSYFLCHDSWWKKPLKHAINIQRKENEQISSQLKSRSKDAWHNSSFWQSWQPRHGGRYWKGQLVTLWTALTSSFGLDP